MALESGSVWAIDIGNNSLKALHLSNVGGTVEVIGFDSIQHGKVLTGSGVKPAERDELIALSLRQFVKKNDLGKADVVVSVPSQNSFARFVKLPPVEQKRIPEIVKFEAAQQIPFDINDVQWDWQLMTEADSPEKRVGIFAIKNEVVSSVLEHFSRENVAVSYVQMAPMALYNYALYDRSDLAKSDSQAIVVLDIGAENTDLVVCTRSAVWQRCIPMGGNAFTRAIADTFKLNFEKAEKLKRTAAMSKYARQVFQAMRPVFTDLASEIQRSLGFYNSSNPNTKLSRIIALGGGTKMRGLLKYLQQTLQMPVERPDSFMKLAMSSGVSTAKFHESVSDFGIVYGLALQGLGLARIESNLLPRSIARSMAWAGKANYFKLAAGLLLFVSVLSFARTFFVDKVSYANNSQVRQTVTGIVNAARQAGSKLEAEQSKASGSEAAIQKVFEPFEYRDVVPLLHQTIFSVLPNEKSNPEQNRLYKAFVDGDVEEVLKTPREERKQVFVTSMSVFFSGDIARAEFGGADLLRAGLKKKRRGKGFGGGMPGMGPPGYGPPGYGGPAGYGGPPGYGPGGGMPGMSKYRSRTRSKGAKGDDSAEDEGEKAGFVVTIVGYSPYKSVGELMDPAGVEDDPSKWGFVTRLLHLDDIFDGNSPFELYRKAQVEHFKLEIGEVDLEAGVPQGIGIRDTKFAKGKKADSKDFGEEVLIDPMTKEIISKVADLDEYGKEKIDRSGNVVYKVNDHWFRLDAKFVWKDAPKEESEDTEISD
ncbi:MAG: type IV pilus assembly protein PilM [Planctomycetota bacterium]|jgi:type IV pilus assembly protein PilM